ncbi:MAG: hypothetical protein Q9175_007839 [Cornicularia normoerica]
MAEAISGIAGGLQGSVGGMLNQGSAWLDSIFPPEKRNELMAKISKFATEKPMLASFIASQIALTGFPLGLFIVMTITVVVFALLAGLIIGLVGAVLFIVVCVGFALVILLPTLFLTTAAATFIWLWGMGGYYILKKFNKKEIPGIHTDMKGGPGGLKNQLGAITGEGGPQGDPSGEEKQADGGAQENGKPKQVNGGPKHPGGYAKGGATKHMNGAADKVGSVGKASGVDVGNPKEAADVGKHAGKVTNAAQGVKGGVSGVTGLG